MQYCVLQVIIKLTSLIFVLAFKKPEYSYISYPWTCTVWINMLNQKGHVTDNVIQIKCTCYYADQYFAPNSIPKLLYIPIFTFYVCLHLEYLLCQCKRNRFCDYPRLTCCCEKK
jgi:hypothetical protein